MKMIISKKQIAEAKGFTLIETLVAITILTFSIVATFTASQSGLSSSIESKNQVIGYYLAQEGVEYIRNMRDTNALAGNNWLFGIAMSGDPCDLTGTGKSCELDIVTNKIDSCPTGPGSCINLVQDQTTGSPTYGMYGTKFRHSSGWAATNFKREIQVQNVATDEILVTVTVTWSKGSQPVQKFEVRESLFNWQS